MATTTAKTKANIVPVVLAAVLGCAGSQGVALTESWPSESSSYVDTTSRWTRDARLILDYSTVVHVFATFKSPEWRAAYVAERARQEHMGSEDRGDLLASQQSDHESFFEVELLVSTHEQSENNLADAKNSAWRVTLIDDRGNQVAATDIARDRRPTPIVRTYFPQLDDFAVPYIARFPRSVSVLREDADQFSIRVASIRGSVELVWKAKP